MGLYEGCLLWACVAVGIRSIAANGDAEFQLRPTQHLYPIHGTEAETFPFSAIGSFSNGCTGSFVGPCQILTAGHCVLDPHSFSFSYGLEFGVAPFGEDGQFRYSFFQRDIKVTERWSTLADPAFDVALVHVHDPSHLIQNQLGYFTIGNSDLRDQHMNLNIAGFPANSTQQLWYELCVNVEFDFDERQFVDHACQVAAGSSGSPMWYYASESGFRELRALHTSALLFNSPFQDSLASQPQGVILAGRLLLEIQSWINELSCEE